MGNLPMANEYKNAAAGNTSRTGHLEDAFFLRFIIKYSSSHIVHFICFILSASSHIPGGPIQRLAGAI